MNNLSTCVQQQQTPQTTGKTTATKLKSKIECNKVQLSRSATPSTKLVRQIKSQSTAASNIIKIDITKPLRGVKRIAPTDSVSYVKIAKTTQPTATTVTNKKQVKVENNAADVEQLDKEDNSMYCDPFVSSPHETSIEDLLNFSPPPSSDDGSDDFPFLDYLPSTPSTSQPGNVDIIGCDEFFATFDPAPSSPTLMDLNNNDNDDLFDTEEQSLFPTLSDSFSFQL